MNPTYSLDGLPNEALLVNLKQLVGSSNELTAHLLAHLAEVEGRGIYRDCACASLYTYCVYELRFSEDEAQRRCRAARMARQFPLILDMLANASIHLTGILLLAPHLTAANHVELLARARYRTKREIEKLVSEVAPCPDAPSLIQPLGPLPAQRGPATWAAFVTSWAGPVRELVAGDGHGQAPLGALARQAAAESASNGGELSPAGTEELAGRRGDSTAWPDAVPSAASDDALGSSAAPRTATGNADAVGSMPLGNATDTPTSDAASASSVHSAGADSRIAGGPPGHDPAAAAAPARKTIPLPGQPSAHSPNMNAAPARQTIPLPGQPSAHSPNMNAAPARQTVERCAGEPLVGLRYRLQFTADQGYVDLLEQARDLLQHQVPDRDLARVHRLAIEALLEKLSKRKYSALGPKGSSAGSGAPAGSPPEGSPLAPGAGSTGCPCAPTHSPGASASSVEPAPAPAPASNGSCSERQSAERQSAEPQSAGPQSAEPQSAGPQSAEPQSAGPQSAEPADPDGRRRHIPAALKRNVWERDGGRCTFTDARGERCRETRWLEFHHHEPFARGGPARLDNVSLHCRSHNRLAAERDFGRDFIASRVSAVTGVRARDPGR